MVCTVQHTEYSLHIVAPSSSPHASMFIGTLNQDLLITPPFPVSIGAGDHSLPENRMLVYIPTVTLFAFMSNSLHYHYHPTMPSSMFTILLPQVLSTITSMKILLRIQTSMTLKLGLWTLSHFAKFFFICF